MVKWSTRLSRFGTQRRKGNIFVDAQRLTSLNLAKTTTKRLQTSSLGIKSDRGLPSLVDSQTCLINPFYEYGDAHTQLHLLFHNLRSMFRFFVWRHVLLSFNLIRYSSGNIHETNGRLNKRRLCPTRESLNCDYNQTRQEWIDFSGERVSGSLLFLGLLVFLYSQTEAGTDSTGGREKKEKKKRHINEKGR